MNKSFSKNKEKRPRTSSNETNTSFVKNVTSRVSGLLPATITKWFSSPSSSNANGSTPTAEVTDSSTEDEATESPIVTQPPAKRMRYNTSSKFSHYGPSDVNCTTSKIEITEIPATHYPGTPFPVNRNSIALSPIRTPNETITNEIKEENKRDTPRFKSKQHTVSSIGQSVASKRKSIFDKSHNEEPPKPTTKPSPSAEKRPCFKPTLLGSPFYPGRTMYGGAASSYLHQPNIQQHTVALVKETKSSEDSAMSSSARRIMDLLESYSSPLMEARRIPQYTKPKYESFNTSTERFAPYANKSLSSKTQELHVPSIASVLRLKQRSRLMDCTKTARQIIASHSSASNYPLTYTPVTSTTTNTTHTTQPSQLRQETGKEQNNKMTTKVKTRVARTNRGNQDELDIATPVKLPTATLQIDQNKLPTFSFTSVSKLPATSTPKVTPPAPKTTESKKINEVSKSNVNETDKSATNAKGWSCPDCWVNNKADVTKCLCCGYKKAMKASKCSMCKLADSQTEKDKCVNCEKMVSLSSTKSSQSSKWKCDGCWVMNEDNVPKCACCGANKPTEANKAATTAKAAEFAAFSKVKQPSCGSQSEVNSDSKQSKPLTPASNAASFFKPSGESDSTFVSLAKTQKSHKWECSGCLVMNESAKSLCVCCGKQKVTSSSDPKQTKPLPPHSNTSSFFGSTDKGDSTFVTFAKSQKSDKWECSSCLVMNESDQSVCVCCGAETESMRKLPQTKFNFGVNNTSFKFGIEPKVQEATITKQPEVQAKTESKLKEQSETNNNVLAETPTFTFTLPTKKIETKVDTLKARPEEAVKFSFGIPKDLEGKELIKIPEKDTEKAQEVPQVNFAAPVLEKPKIAFGSFGTTVTEVEKEKSLIPPPNLFASPTVETKTDTPSNPMTSQPGALIAEKPPLQKTFTLGSSTLKPASNLFGTPTAGNSANLFSAPPQSSAITTSTPTIAPLLPTVSAQKIETTNTAPALAAPMFSFGTNGVNSSSSISTVESASGTADKPKFQFTFGSSNSTKTETTPSMLGATTNAQPVMKSMFAPSGENAKTINAFSLTPGNTLVSSNAMDSNALGGSNGLSPSNGLGGNTLSGNPIGGNALSGNSLSGNLLTGNAVGGNTFSTNNLSGGNGVSSTSTLGGTNGLPGNTLTSGNGLQPNNTLASNTLTNSATSIFGGTVQKENMWNPNNNAPSSNMFVPNTTTNSLQKPSTFTFGTSTPFNAASSTPAFGSNAQPPPNIFGMANQNNNVQPSLFSNPVQNQNPAPMFGSPPPNSNPAPQMDMFASQNIGTTPTFGTPNSSIASFEVSSMTAAPAPAFNFGAASQPSGIFGFGQQPQQPQATGGFNFGAPPAAAPQGVQFAMGTAPGPRKIRKARRSNMR